MQDAKRILKSNSTPSSERCALYTASAQRPLLGLKAHQFRHPLDLEATRQLQQLLGLDVVVRTLLGGLTEKFLYMENLASSIQVSAAQLPELHELLLDACHILDLEPPQLYIRQHPVPNAYTLAMRGQQPFIVVHTALLELLNPPEIQAVLAHELGHLKCEHGVYLTLANLLVLAAGQIPWGNILSQSLQAQMLHWVRCAELTCDRAALLATQDPKVMMSVLMKLTGGSPALADRLNLKAFIDQARQYDRASQTDLGQMLRELQTSQLTHPLPVLRAREVDRWANSVEYQTLLQQSLGKDEALGQRGWRNW
ncbi:M48 family metallopeptidase [Alkalinema sp. FACHB-956]|uniref:M48 family metallopeptidase n=1 Tax=Alkalinema sp. FACHB-956 TaxID=2692768 RepID=UPI0016847C30|nr:M48 family metallopeptidase [Alkalinema sp. FACHB-956]MBD2329388.1 M48 family metallopeptidase [Alkalinema sp. FACHB-956]